MRVNAATQLAGNVHISRRMTVSESWDGSQVHSQLRCRCFFSDILTHPCSTCVKGGCKAQSTRLPLEDLEGLGVIDKSGHPRLRQELGGCLSGSGSKTLSTGFIETVILKCKGKSKNTKHVSMWEVFISSSVRPSKLLCF